MPRHGIDRTGTRNGRLTYVRLVGLNKFKQRLWEAQCDCGNVVVVHLVTTKSCGCLQLDRASEANQHPKTEEVKQRISEVKRIKGTPHTCRKCGKEFVGTKLQRFCDKSCQKAFFETRGTYGSRAELNGAKREPVAFWKVYERDGGICQCCKEPALRELRGSVNRLAPTLGHIIPLARGGDHTYANTQLEHLGCNLAKGDSLPDGVVEPRTNPDPRTREQKISDRTTRQWANPVERERLLAAFAKRKHGPRGPYRTKRTLA